MCLGVDVPRNIRNDEVRIQPLDRKTKHARNSQHSQLLPDLLTLYLLQLVAERFLSSLGDAHPVPPDIPGADRVHHVPRL